MIINYLKELVEKRFQLKNCYSANILATINTSYYYFDKCKYEQVIMHNYLTLQELINENSSYFEHIFLYSVSKNLFSANVVVQLFSYLKCVTPYAF